MHKRGLLPDKAEQDRYPATGAGESSPARSGDSSSKEGRRGRRTERGAASRYAPREKERAVEGNGEVDMGNREEGTEDAQLRCVEGSARGGKSGEYRCFEFLSIYSRGIRSKIGLVFLTPLPPPSPNLQRKQTSAREREHPCG